MGSALRLPRALRFGMLPAVQTDPDDGARIDRLDGFD
jgi:hypothetical protein